MAKFANPAEGPEGSSMTTQEQGAVKPFLAEPGGGPSLAPGSPVDPDVVEEILRPTDFPGRPVTHGLPFGAGAMFTQKPTEDQARFRKRVAGQLKSSPAVSPKAKKILDAFERGI